MFVSRCSLRFSLALGLAVVACAPTVTKDPDLATSAATLALFAPDKAEPCKSVLPFPSDLAKNLTTGRLDIPFCLDDSADQTAIKGGLRTLDGWSVGVTLTTRFSGAIDPASLTDAVKLYDGKTGLSVPVDAQFVASKDNTLYLIPKSPLDEGTSYIAVVTTAVKDLAGKPIASDKVFVFTKSEQPLVDALGYSRTSALSNDDANSLEALRLGFAPMFEALAKANIPRNEVAVAWGFTTQTTQKALPLLAGFVTAVQAARPATVVHQDQVAAKDHPLIAAAGIPAANLCDVHVGQLTLTNLLTAGGTFGADATGKPVSSALSVDYMLVTPVPRDATGAALPCTTPWAGDKVMVFAHGLGRCKNDALALADDFAKLGLATLTLDGPNAGSRMTATLGDRDLDGCPDQPAIPEFIALPGAAPNPFAVRDHLREWGLELSQISTAVKATPFAFAGMTAPAGAAAPKIALLGHSWGGMAVALASAAGAPAEVVVMNAASGELGAVFQPAIQQSVAAGLTAAGITDFTVEPGKSLLHDKTAESVAAFRWAMEPADPVFAPTLARIPALVQVVSSGAVTMPDAALHATETQKNLATAFGMNLTKVVFDLSSAGTAICDSSTSVVGALLQPCIKNKLSPNYPAAGGKTVQLRMQVLKFVRTALAGAPEICDPSQPCN